MSIMTERDYTHQHPSWCDPRACETTEHDLEHSGHALRWEASQDFTVEMRVRRVDEPKYQEVGGTFVELTTQSTAFVEEASVTNWTPAEARVLACRLIAAAALAEDLFGGGQNA